MWCLTCVAEFTLGDRVRRFVFSCFIITQLDLRSNCRGGLRWHALSSTQQIARTRFHHQSPMWRVILWQPVISVSVHRSCHMVSTFAARYAADIECRCRRSATMALDVSLQHWQRSRMLLISLLHECSMAAIRD